MTYIVLEAALLLDGGGRLIYPGAWTLSLGCWAESYLNISPGQLTKHMILACC